MCAIIVLWCMNNLSFKVPMCVGSMLWRVRTLSLQRYPVCGPCAVVCGDFEIFKFPTVRGSCAVVSGEFVRFSKFPCVRALCCGV